MCSSEKQPYQVSLSKIWSSPEFFWKYITSSIRMLAHDYKLLGISVSSLWILDFHILKHALKAFQCDRFLLKSLIYKLQMFQVKIKVCLNFHLSSVDHYKNHVSKLAALPVVTITIDTESLFFFGAKKSCLCLILTVI